MNNNIDNIFNEMYEEEMKRLKDNIVRIYEKSFCGEYKPIRKPVINFTEEEPVKKSIGEVENLLEEKEDDDNMNNKKLKPLAKINKNKKLVYKKKEDEVKKEEAPKKALPKLPKLNKKKPVAKVAAPVETVEVVNEVAPVEELNYEHMIQIDSTNFEKKPTAAQMRSLNMKETRMSINALAVAVQNGQCFKPYYLSKSGKFIASGLIAFSIENRPNAVKMFGKVSVNDFMEEALKADAKPVLVYKTLNTTKKLDRFVAIYQLDQAIDNYEEYRKEIVKIIPEYADVMWEEDIVLGAKEVLYVNPNNIIETEYGKLTAEQEAMAIEELEAIDAAEEEAILKEIEYYESGQDKKDREAEHVAELNRRLSATNKEIEWWHNASESQRKLHQEYQEKRKIWREVHEAEREVKAGIRAAKAAASLQEAETAVQEAVTTHKVLLDTKAYNSKPTGLTAGSIQKRLPECTVNITIEQLANKLASGHTFKPVYMTGRSQDTFVSSSLVVIDIDNKGEELEKYGYVSVQEFVKKTKTSQYKPAIVYTTFSHTAALNKYRAVFQLNRTVTNLNELAAILAELKAEYPFADAKVSPVHLIYGGKELILLDANAVIAPEVEYDKEVNITRAKDAEIKKVVTEKITVSEAQLISNLSSLKEKFEGTVIDIADSFDWINKNIPMTTALGIDLNTKFRCIFPDHIDNEPSARIRETIEGQQNYVCSCGHTYKSLIDVTARLLNKNKVMAQYTIADAVGITIGSQYQKNMRLLIADIMANTNRIIKPDSVMYKYMTRSNLHGLYNLIQQFASAHITQEPLGAADQITFFMSRSQIQEKMWQFNMKGASTIGYKLNALKELGLIRALRDEEINVDSLAKANSIKNSMTLEAGKSKNAMNRIEYYELTLVTPQVVKEAERIIQLQKDLGVKRKHMNATRRALALGEDFAAKVNVQVDVIEKVYNPKTQKELDKVLKAASHLINTQKYFTEEQLRQAYDPHRKQRKEAAIKTINDAIPYVMQNLNIKKDRVKQATQTLYSIPSKIKTNTTIYC